MKKGTTIMNEKEISLFDLFNMCLRNKVLIAVLVVVFTVVTFLYTTLLVAPTYTAKGTLYVTIDNNYSAQANVNINDIMAAQELTNTYLTILSSNTFMKTISAECGLGYTFEDIKAMARLFAEEDSEIIQVTATTYDPHHSAIIVNTILSNAQSEISRLVVGGSAKIIDHPEIPKTKSSPSVSKNCIFAIVMAIALGCVINFIRAYFDDSIDNVEELAEKLEIPLLAEIPVYEEKTSSASS